MAGTPLINPAAPTALKTEPAGNEQPQTQSTTISTELPATQPLGGVSIGAGGPSGPPPGYLSESLAAAECLLAYAAQVGIPFEDEVRDAIIKARSAFGVGMSDQIAANLLSALTRLAAKVKPVTAESLKATANSKTTRKVIRAYLGMAILLVLLIVPYSLLTFVSAAISDSIRKNLELANTLAVKLSDELGPPPANEAVVQPAKDANAAVAQARLGTTPLPHGVTEKDVIRDLQQFAAAIRAIDGESRKLNGFVLGLVTDPLASHRRDPGEMRKRLELTPGLPYPLATEAADKIGVYQEVRYYAQSIQEWVAIFYGAIANCILPLLYSLLGACAYLLRALDERIKNRTFTPSNRDYAHVMIAAIAGLVVGLFNNFNTQTANLSPLAYAFLVGYAVDVFFSFLESFLQTFTRAKASPSPANA